jgi:hypothetical protein
MHKHVRILPKKKKSSLWFTTVLVQKCIQTVLKSVLVTMNFNPISSASFYVKTADAALL